MSPAAVLKVAQQMGQALPAEATLLAIRGARFELGEPLSATASHHLDAALAWARAWLAQPFTAPAVRPVMI